MDQVEQSGGAHRVGFSIILDHLVRVGPFKLIRGDPGRPDGWIHPDMVVNEEEEVLVEIHQEEVQGNNSSDQVLLFHLDDDPYEKKNLATEFSAITQYMGRLLDQYQARTIYNTCSRR